MVRHDDSGETGDQGEARHRPGNADIIPSGSRKVRHEAAGKGAAEAGPLCAGRDRNGQPPSDDGRFEYRIWPRQSHPAATRLSSHWRQVGAERRADIYMLHRDSERVLIKLRGGTRIEIKQLRFRVGTVEHWTMPLSADFPLTASARSMIAEALVLRRRLPETSGLTAAHLLASLGASIVPLPVRKSRLLFRAASCRAEICRVAVDDWTGHTIALEAPDIPTIAVAIDELELGSLPNRSYGEVLLQLRSPWPGLRRLPFAGPGNQ